MRERGRERGREREVGGEADAKTARLKRVARDGKKVGAKEKRAASVAGRKAQVEK